MDRRPWRGAMERRVRCRGDSHRQRPTVRAGGRRRTGGVFDDERPRAGAGVGGTTRAGQGCPGVATASRDRARDPAVAPRALAARHVGGVHFPALVRAGASWVDRAAGRAAARGQCGDVARRRLARSADHGRRHAWRVSPAPGAPARGRWLDPEPRVGGYKNWSSWPFRRTV